MLFAVSSFGEAVANPDPWQMILGAIIPVVMAWMSGRFPLLASILKMLGVNIQPAPVDPSTPVPPPAPVDPVSPQPDRPLAELLKKLVELLLKRKAEIAEIEATLKQATEAKP